MLRRAIGSSSTINVLILFLVISITCAFHRQERNRQPDLHAALSTIMRFEPPRGAVKLRDPRAGVGQPNAIAILNSPACGQSRPIVVYIDLQTPVVAAGAQANSAPGVARGDAVPDGVFDDWLQDETWDLRRQRIPVDLHLHPEPV